MGKCEEYNRVYWGFKSINLFVMYMFEMIPRKPARLYWTEAYLERDLSRTS